MKTIFYKLSITCLLAIGLVSCEEDKVVLDPNNGSNLWSFNQTSSELPLTEDLTVFADTIEVGVTSLSDVDRVIPINVDASSTATSDQYTLQSSSLVIPAGEFVGKVVLTSDFANIPDNTTVTVVLTLDESAVDILDEKNFHVVNIFRSCPTDLEGTYSVTTTYGFHDFLPDFSEYTMEVEITQEDGLNTYSVLDFSGGLYSVGPYDAAYGTGSAANAGNRDLVFSVNCGNITWSGQSDPYGAIVPTGGAVNSYNEDTGVLTISWTAVGYGENGVSVYTPVN